MSATAQQSIEADLDRLERQRVGYALALASSQDERSRTRHERTLARLDEEIAALLEALEQVAYSPPVPPRAHDGVPVVDRTAEFTPEEYDLAVAPRGTRALRVAAAVGVIVVIAAVLWVGLRPAPTAAPAPAAPSSVTVTSPVPPDSSR